MKIRCPTCKNVVCIHGNPQEKIFITCSNCNAQGVFTIPSNTPIQPPQKERNLPRPIGVTIIAILAIIGALMTIFSTVTYVFLSSLMGSSTSLNFVLLLLVLLCIVFIAISFMIAYGFWKGLRWSWFLATSLIIIGIISSIIAVFWSLIQYSATSFSYIFDLLFFFIILRGVFFVILYSLIFGLILFYLTRPFVRMYFHVNQHVDIKTTLKGNRKILYILAIVFIATAIILLWGFQSTGPVTLISLIQTPEHPQEFEDVTITAEITGGSPFGGAGATVTYISYFGTGGASGTKPLTSIGDNRYTATFHGSESAEIWCLIKSGNLILANHTIQVGHVERSNITTLAIGNITQTPKNPTSDTAAITITVEVTSNVTITYVECLREIFSPHGSSGGNYGGMSKIGNTTYSETIGPYGSPVAFDSYNQKFLPGTTIYYRIIAKDEAGNTAVITKNIII